MVEKEVSDRYHCEPLMVVWLRPSTTEPYIWCNKLLKSTTGDTWNVLYCIVLFTPSEICWASQPVSFINYDWNDWFVCVLYFIRNDMLHTSANQYVLLQSKLQQILLIPEFCCMTGLTDNMRQDFKVMKVCVWNLVLFISSCNGCKSKAFATHFPWGIHWL